MEREANIARNRALLAALDVTADLPQLVKQNKPAKSSAKPVRPAKRTKRERDSPLPVRQSARLRRTVVGPKETPAQKRKREVFLLTYMLVRRTDAASRKRRKRDVQRRRKNASKQRRKRGKPSDHAIMT